MIERRDVPSTDRAERGRTQRREDMVVERTAVSYGSAALQWVDTWTRK